MDSSVTTTNIIDIQSVFGLIHSLFRPGFLRSAYLGGGGGGGGECPRAITLKLFVIIK